MGTFDIFTGKSVEKVMMEVVDSGVAEACGIMALFECPVCHTQSDWLLCESYEEVEQGVQCEPCNLKQTPIVLSPLDAEV